jgi:hypothetical protein
MHQHASRRRRRRRNIAIIIIQFYSLFLSANSTATGANYRVSTIT